jgi:DNA-binding NtrC family response regulator
VADHAALQPGSEVLVLEDDAVQRKRCSAYLRSQGAEVTEASNLAEARRLLRDVPFDFALIDLHLPDGESLELLRTGAFSENTGIVVMTAFGAVGNAVEAMRHGAGDYLTKPFELDELPLAFLRCRERRLSRRRDEHHAGGLASSAAPFFFGTSLHRIHETLQAILAADRRLEQHLPPLLIEGETGTGKTALARWVHQQGPRASRTFLALNCAAVPDHLAESELFGHERGAFTDAKQARVGLFEAADGGTLFLDEIAALSPAVQAKVLAAVEDRRIRRLGSNREILIDARVIAASNRPLAEMAAGGQFRPDLYHRLDLLRIALPPLRERGTDIIALARHLLVDLRRRYRKPHLQLSAAAEARLVAQPWPGNVRELAHELERATVFASGDVLELSHLSGNPETTASDWRNPAWRLPESGFSLDAAIDELVDLALRETGNNVSAAARRLGVTREFIRYRLSQRASAAPASP